MRCCYVNDPTLTWDENDEQIWNQFFTDGNTQVRENTTSYLNLNSNVLALTGSNNDETSIFHEEGNININQNLISENNNLE